MNWIVLFIAGVFEVAMTFCLGKTKGAQGTELYLWIGIFEFDRCRSGFGVHLQIRPMYSGENRRNDDGSVYRSIIGKNIL